MILMELFGRDSCSSLVFHTKEAGASSIVSEWGLVCDLNYKSKVSSTVYQYNLHSKERRGMIKVVAILQGTMSAFMAGVMIGAFMLGKLADRCSFPEFFLLLHSSFQTLPRIGRKHTITITVLGITVFNTLSGITGSFNVYVGAKFATGFFCAGNILSMFVLSNELVGGSKRALVGTTMQVIF